jgi:hypothetical protein
MSCAKVRVVISFPGYAPEKLKYPIDRYVNETHRLYRTLNSQLAKNGTGYIVGDRVTVADIAIWPWVAAHSKLIDTPIHAHTNVCCKISLVFPRLLHIPRSRSGSTSFFRDLVSRLDVTFHARISILH